MKWTQLKWTQWAVLPFLAGISVVGVACGGGDVPSEEPVPDGTAPVEPTEPAAPGEPVDPTAPTDPAAPGQDGPGGGEPGQPVDPPQ
ncbi:hypothetical protein [Leptolyngbya sp. PCC 6406]|uniref:hypothetical protein n=1 Tax=Leptolyngbya sp. PCC 6406 TaxID=1173264 RepID=UPI0002AC0C37|nr:hypothetical protein [Leptolyngbya sp. PCC 6406]